MLEKIFGRNKKKTEPDPQISFGRYSDNNKSLQQISRWKDAEQLFRDHKIPESLDAFFEYLHDTTLNNVVHERTGSTGSFTIFQGSKTVKGRYDENNLQAEVSLAHMVAPNVPVMRRLLELNFHVYYSRYALDGQRLCMLFDTPMKTASPGKLYYGLKELATRADKQDDLLVHDFSMLEMTETDHIEKLPQEEMDTRCRYFQLWVNELLDQVEELDPEKFSGGIAYLILALLFRIDFLLKPEGKLLHEIEKIIQVYYKKDERPVVEKNRDMLKSIRQLKQKSKEELAPNFFNAKYTFSIVQPQPYKNIADSIGNASQNVGWYNENGYPQIARQITEYALTYSQFSSSLPRPVTMLIHLFMMVNHPAFFKELGFKQSLFDEGENKPDKEAIEDRLEIIEKDWQVKYPRLKINKEKIKYHDLLQFNISFTREMENLDLDT